MFVKEIIGGGAGIFTEEDTSLIKGCFTQQSCLVNSFTPQAWKMSGFRITRQPGVFATTFRNRSSGSEIEIAWSLGELNRLDVDSLISERLGKYLTLEAQPV